MGQQLSAEQRQILAGPVTPVKIMPTPTCASGSTYSPQFDICVGGAGPPSAPKCPDGYIRRGGRTGGWQFGAIYDIGFCEEDPATKAAKEAEEAAAAAATAAAKLQADTAAAAEKAQKDIDKYTLSFNAVQTQKNQIQKTAEVMNAAAGKYTGVSKDLQYSVDQFDTHLKDLQNKINITNRRTPAPSWWPWLDIFLNVMIVLVLLYAIYALVRRTYYVHPPVSQVGYH